MNDKSGFVGVANFATAVSDGKEFNNELIIDSNVHKMHIPNSQQD